MKLHFEDIHQVRWNRGFDGRLSEQDGQWQRTEIDEDEGALQLGDPTNTFNPLWVALAFLDLIRREDPQATISELSPLLAENAPGWASLDASMIQEISDELAEYGTAAHVYYRAPQVAYVRLVHEQDQRNDPDTAGRIEVRLQIITLVFYAGIGWKVFSVGSGATEPDWIKFPPHSIAADPRVMRYEDESRNSND